MERPRLAGTYSHSYYCSYLATCSPILCPTVSDVLQPCLHFLEGGFLDNKTRVEQRREDGGGRKEARDLLPSLLRPNTLAHRAPGRTNSAANILL